MSTVDTSRVLCTIPARAGSKRLPHKNLLPLADKPMLAYTIETALATGLFAAVYVCTEDQTIAEVAIQYGATVPTLVPAELAGDLVPSHIPCQYMATRLASAAAPIDSLLCLQPTSPLRSVDDIRQGVEHFIHDALDFLVSVTSIDPHYFHWALQPKDEPFWGMYFGQQYLLERSLLPPVYRPNGSIKIARLSALQAVGNFFGERLDVIETPEERSVHVATRLDFDLCELILRKTV
jgi:CMP-N-acetylneuraminic acid synthetase